MFMVSAWLDFVDSFGNLFLGIAMAIGAGMVLLGLYTALLASKHADRRNKNRVASGEPEFTAEEHKQAIKQARGAGAACILVGLIVFFGVGALFLF